ncbi:MULTISPECIES: O-antigen ligase [unclassified Legionella]|uniref:O-antigen ligase family protein n=1 Tax=unclassified Legionella TaxID=2622702 RepID=UPI0010556C69|nr:MULTISPECIES: O-antigen ligase family protein [unclassified Legionella]MDI9819666.1 O-antigen ligase family protein [Legionella sp. PL877]
MDTLANYSQKFSLQQAIPFLLAATLLTLPMSSTAKSISLGLSVFAILLTSDYRAQILNSFSNTWCKAALLLFLMTLVACFWSPAGFSDKMFVVEKYSKLLYLPVLLVGFQKAKTRTISLHAFLLAMLITCGLSILKFHGYLQFLNFKPDHVFRNHIMTGFMVAFAAYLSCLLGYRQKGAHRYFYGLLLLIFTYQILFINEGRTGYVIYLLLLSLFILQICSWRQAIAGILLIFAFFSASYITSPVMKMRVDAIGQQIHGYQHNQKDTDIGLRLQFHDFAYQLFSRHPLAGNGTASFTYYFEKEKPVPMWSWKLLEPHSQYWLIAAEFGLLGTGAWLLLLISLAYGCWRLDKMRPVAFSMLIPFAIGNLSDSLLFYSGSGYFFILFMALCLGEQIEINKKKTAGLN